MNLKKPKSIILPKPPSGSELPEDIGGLPAAEVKCEYCEERLRVNVGLLKENIDLKRKAGRQRNDDDGFRLYVLLALFDTRDGGALAELVRSAREGYERSAPDMNEPDAWDEFDQLWKARGSHDLSR